MVKEADDNSSGYLTDEKAVRRFVRQMLKNHIFIGNFIEQRYVAELGCYKKIVQIPKTEDIFLEDLSVAKRRLDRIFAGTKWIGITFPNTPGAPVGFNLWVEIEEQIFGTYKFRVKDIEFLENQISLKLQIVTNDDKQNSRLISENSMLHNNSSQDLMSEDLEVSIPHVISWRNLKEVTIFMFLLLTAVITGGGQILMFLMDYVLKLLRELSNIIGILTPIFVAGLDTISKIFGYICFLIAMLWRDRHSPKEHLFYPQKIQDHSVYPHYNRYKAIDYKPRSSVKITELSD